MTQSHRIRPTVLLRAERAEVRQAVSLRLAEAGYAHRQVSSASEVCRSLETPQVEALVWIMEGAQSDAMRLLDQLRDRESDACVIVMGPELGAEQVSAFLRNGAYDYLSIPARPGRLEESLRQGLANRRSFREVRGLSGQLQTANDQLARERDSLRRLNRSLVALNQLSQALSGTHDADDIARLVARRVPALLPYDRLSITWRELERIWVSTSGGEHVEESPSNGRTDGFARQCLVQSDFESRCRAQTCQAGDPIVDAIDVPLVSKNEDIGRFRLERLQGEPFDAADREFMVTVAASLALTLANADAHRSLEQMAMKDGLTNLFNRRAFDQLLSQEVKAAERYRSPLCLLLADIDYFKSVNDHFGHPIGDTLLKEVGTLLAESLREVDIVARYGGEEFAIILPRTDVHSGCVLANRIREQITRHAFMADRSLVRLTLSVGVAGFIPGSMRAKEDLLEAADRALYHAKACGRNRVEIHEGTCPHPHVARVYAQP